MRRSAEGAASVASAGTSALFAARLFLLASGLVVSILLARGLGPADFGLYGLAITLLTWVQLLIGWSMPGAVARLAPHHARDPRIAGTALVLLAAAATLGYALVWWVAPRAAAALARPELTWVLRLLFLDLFFTAAMAVYHGLFYADGRVGWVGVTLIVQSGVKLALIAGLLVFGLDLERVILAHLAGSLAALALVATRVAPPRPAFVPGFARALCAGSLGLLGYTLAYQFQANAGIWWTAALWPERPDATGAFAAAQTVTRVLTVVQSALSAVLFARVADAVARAAAAEARAEIATALRYALILLLPAVAALWASAGAVVELLYGEAYAEAASILRWLALGGLGAGLLDILAHGLMGGFGLWRGVVVAAVVVPAALLSGIVLVPLLGPAGVAAALAVGTLAATALAAVWVVRRVGAVLPWASLARTAAASGVLYAVLAGWSVPPALLVPQFALAGAGYLVLLWLLREVDGRDLALLTGKGGP
ncbi:hypothetical protein HRbin39_01406 [bacterium HR39]|nr:hypothetical protein HRbin39_01406 [bacterium HR39]